MTPNIEKQPLSQIEWVKRDQLRANEYNPNYVMPPELELLKISILEDGWTQPIVARESYFHLSFPCGHHGKIPIEVIPQWKNNIHQKKSWHIPLEFSTVKVGSLTDLIDRALQDAHKESTITEKNFAESFKKHGESEKFMNIIQHSENLIIGQSAESMKSDGSLKVLCLTCLLNDKRRKNYYPCWNVKQAEVTEDDGQKKKTTSSANIGENGMEKSWKSSTMDEQQTQLCYDDAHLESASRETVLLEANVVFEIVDGFHRWKVSEDAEIAALTDGFVPVVRINPPKDQQMMATIRHNRARGSHIVLRMADIVSSLIDEQGLSKEEVCQRLMMEEEEVTRLYDRGVMIDRGSREDFNKGWIPKKSERSSI